MTEVKELLFGTTNKAKVQQVQGALGESVIVKAIDAFGVDIDVEEDGTTAQENARKKAVTYAKALGRTVFAMDNALYFKGLDDDEQPGLYVRRIGGVARSSDEEMIESYTELIGRHGGRLEGWWEFAVSIAKPDGRSVEESILSPRLFVARASTTIVAGYPLESIQIDPDTNKYVSDMSDDEQALFWQRNIGKPLKRFIQNNT